MKLCCFQYSVLVHDAVSRSTGLNRNEPILSETDIDCDNIKAIKYKA